MRDEETRHGRRARTLLSLFFLLHLTAVGTYLAPLDPETVAILPQGMREPVQKILPPLVHRAWPVTRHYLDLTATRQHWYLFAPDPAEWSPEIRVVAYFPLEDGEASERSAGFASEGERLRRWAVDTVRIAGPRRETRPHLWDHRRYRILFNLGYERWGAFYRPFFAAGRCREFRDPRGTPPEGVELLAAWTRTRIPWREDRGEERYVQDLGGYTCPGEERG